MSISHLKPVPNPPYRLNILRFGRVKLYLLANLLNMHRYSGNVPNGLHIPYLAEQLLFGKHMVRVLGKEGQKVKFLCGKGFLLPVDPHAPGCLIYFQAADFNQLIGRLPIRRSYLAMCAFTLATISLGLNGLVI